MEENSRVNVQSIRKMFERSNSDNSRNSSTSCNSCNNNGATVSSRNGSPIEYESGGFMMHNRISIKRSPAFRTGPKSLDLTEKRKPKAAETPCKSTSNKSEICKLEICKSDCWRIEEALKAPLPTGPAPKKPPRTFLHNSCSNQLDSAGTSAAGSAGTPEAGSISSTGSTGSSLSSPQRPARSKVNRLHEKPAVIVKGPFTMIRSKTESSLVGRGTNAGSGSSGSRNDPSDEAVQKDPTRGLNPIQSYSFSPPGRKIRSGIMDQNRSGGFSKSLWHLADQPLSLPTIPPAPTIRRSRIPLSRKQLQPLKESNVQCNNQARSNWNLRSKPSEMQTKRCSYPQAQREVERGGIGGGGGGGRSYSKTQLSIDSHYYDDPLKEDDLHYMCSPIIGVADINNWNIDKTDESDADSEIIDIKSKLQKFFRLNLRLIKTSKYKLRSYKLRQLVEDRKMYARQVSSNICDLKRGDLKSASNDPSSGLFETLLVGALYFDRQTHQHTSYIKSFYPKQSRVPSGVEHFCFPDSNQWPPPLASAAEPYTIILTDANGNRMYGYCRRIVPEGAQTCIPITYCLITRHRAAGFYGKLMNLIASRHGTSESQRAVLFDYLYAQKFPSPGRFIEFPLDGKVVKLQRMLDNRLEDIDLRVLFDHLNETTVLHILATMLLERKLIFISQNLNVLSVCVDAVQSMLYPFTWQHTLVPILPPTMTEISSAPTPFILGILSKNIDDWRSIVPDQGMLVDLDSGKVLHSVGDESSILPRRSQRMLRSAWEVTFNITQQAESARNALLSQSFLRMFIDLCGHYQHHIRVDAESGHKYFQRETFGRDHSSQGVRIFLEWFTETAMFSLFIESRLRHDAVQTIFEEKIMEHSIHLGRNNQLIVPNSKLLGRKIKTIGDKLREMNVFS